MININGRIKKIKRIIVSVIGFTVLAIGIIMIIIPGPAFVIIPIGLSILATEFVWAKKLLEKVKKSVRNTKVLLTKSK